MFNAKVAKTARASVLLASVLLSALASTAYAGGAFSYRIPLSPSNSSATARAASADAPIVPPAPPATSYPFYQWPSWFPKTADGYVIDWYTYDNNRDGLLDGTRVGANIPVMAYVLSLTGGNRTVLSVEPLTPGLSFDTGLRDGSNCFEAGQAPAPTVNGNGTDCYVYPKYVVKNAGENKVAFKIKHTLGEDIVGMAFYGYDGPNITTSLAATVSLGTIASGNNATVTFHATNTGKGSGTLKDSMYGSWSGAACPGVTMTYNGATFAPGAECDVTVTWPAYYKLANLKAIDVMGAQVGVVSTLSWTTY